LQATAYSSDDTTKLEDGTLVAVSNQMNISTGMVQLRANFANTDQQLFPNEFVNVHLLVNTLDHATLVPNPAVQTGSPGTYVYVVNADNTVSVQPVTTGPTDGTDTVITKGLTPGQTVVVDGVDRLSAGAKVTVIAAPAPGDPATPAAAPPAQPGHRHRHAANGKSGAATPAPAQP
jgi:multidrug efflux system membrane fusion protein